MLKVLLIFMFLFDYGVILASTFVFGISRVKINLHDFNTDIPDDYDEIGDD